MYALLMRSKTRLNRRATPTRGARIGTGRAARENSVASMLLKSRCGAASAEGGGASGADLRRRRQVRASRRCYPLPMAACPTWELTTVLWAEQLTSEESAVSFAVKAAMQQGVRFRAIRSGSLYQREALPFAADLADLPNVFTPFRKAVEGSTAPPWEEGFVKGGISRGDGAQLVRNSHEIGPGLPFRAA